MFSVFLTKWSKKVVAKETKEWNENTMNMHIHICLYAYIYQK